MLRIELQGVGKKFNSEWIFRNVNSTFNESSVSAILGRNGSGKSTLLQVIAGNLHPTAGKVNYLLGDAVVPVENIFRHLALVAPYMELIEDFTLHEMLRFHFSFKPFIPGMDAAKVTEILGLGDIRSKHIRQFSSGMKQRVKLATAIFSNVPLLLLDEPTMNLDNVGIEWYLGLIGQFRGNRTVIICSNQHQTESAFAGQQLRIEDFKT